MTKEQAVREEPKLTLAQMLAVNLGAALRGEITAEQAQANADQWREEMDGEQTK